MSQKLIMCRGLPWSGKSTWAKEYVKSTAKSVRINNDDLRASFYGRKFNRGDEDFITWIRERAVEDALKSGFTVVVDNTNLNPIHEELLRLIADKHSAAFEIKEFAVDVQTCIDRDKLRANPVGEKVIRDMAKRNMYYPEPPREFPKVVQGFGKPAFIFDIDGTLAYMNNRNPYDYSKVSTDGCHQDVADMAGMLKSWFDIIICSGRKDDCRKETEDWLIKNKIPFDLLLMRKSDDNRNDAIVKYEILINDIIPHYFIHWVFDDRDRVVRMWREAWLRCYQVNYGNF